MATAASLKGIKDNGLRWKAVVKIDMPSDIPSLFEDCETNADAIKLGHSICFALIKSLNSHKLYPRDSTEWLQKWIDELDETFLWNDIEDVESWASDEMADGLEDELIYRLDGLYDWADYHRVCLSSK